MMVFSSEKDVMLFSVPPNPTAYDPETKILKYSDLSFSNTTKQLFEGKLITVLPLDNTIHGLSLLIRDGNSIFTRRIMTDSLALNCPDSSIEKLEGVDF